MNKMHVYPVETIRRYGQQSRLIQQEFNFCSFVLNKENVVSISEKNTNNQESEVPFG